MVAEADDPPAALADAAFSLGDNVPDDAAAVIQAALDAWAAKVPGSPIAALLAEQTGPR